MIIEEIQLLLISFSCGIIYMIIYDLLRIYRKICKASVGRVIIEDLLFWICVAYFFFNILIEHNYGRLRAYPVIGMISAMFIYEITVGKRIVGKITEALRIINKKVIRPFLILLKKVLKPFKLKRRENRKFKGKKVSKCLKLIRGEETTHPLVNNKKTE